MQRTTIASVISTVALLACRGSLAVGVSEDGGVGADAPSTCEPSDPACSASCNSSSCPSGCCSGGRCLPGTAESACGAGAGACIICLPQQTCAAGTCGGGRRVVLFGGADIHNDILGDTWVFDGAAWMQRSSSPGPSAREGASMTTLDDKVVLFGGSSGAGSQNFGDTWTFDGTSWTLATTSGPSPRWGAAMATLNGSVVLFGGNRYDGSNDEGYAEDTWVFDGAAWTQVSASGPPARDSAAMSPINGKIVLFGGENASPGAGFGDTWTFDGTTWTQVPTAPPADLAPTMATLGDEIVLSGYGDTWTFDGATWTQISSSGPPSRQWASMAVLTGKIVLFGGGGSENGSAVDFGDTWTFGGTWAQVSGSGPPARDSAAMATLP